MKILAIDPGKTVGLAHWDEGRFQWSAQDEKWSFLEWADPSEWDRRGVGWFDTVIIERYIITPRTAKLSQQHDALDVLGCIRYWCRIRGVPLTEHSASEAKSFSTDDKLKAAGMWNPGNDHACDAARHLLLYLIRAKIMDPAILL